jgi:hypothetical protein
MAEQQYLLKNEKDTRFFFSTVVPAIYRKQNTLPPPVDDTCRDFISYLKYHKGSLWILAYLYPSFDRCIKIEGRGVTPSSMTHTTPEGVIAVSELMEYMTYNEE